jgi:hypothetical protein
MSLFDAPVPYLSPLLWDEHKQLKPEVKVYLVKLLEEIYPVEKVHAMVMLGSSVGYQYSATSDIDTNVMGRKGETFEAWHTIFKKFNNRPNLFPGTQRPINFFFQEYIPDTDWSNSLGAYDILANKWIKAPISFEHIGDPIVKYEREIAYGKMLLSMIESQVKRAKEANARGDKDTAHRIYTELAIQFKQIENNRKDAYKYGHRPALHEYNIIYKLIEGSEHHDVFKKLIDYYDSEIDPL